MVWKWVQNTPQGDLHIHLKGKYNVWQSWISLAFFWKGNTWHFKLGMCRLWSMSCICPRRAIKIEHYICRWQCHDAVLNYDTFILNKVFRKEIQGFDVTEYETPMKECFNWQKCIKRENLYGQHMTKSFCSSSLGLCLKYYLMESHHIVTGLNIELMYFRFAFALSFFSMFAFLFFSELKCLFCTICA